MIIRRAPEGEADSLYPVRLFDIADFSGYGEPGIRTVHQGIVGTMGSLSKLKLQRFAAGVITDVCLTDGAETNVGLVERVVAEFIHKQGGMMTVAVCFWLA